MGDGITVRGLALSKYQNISEFAKAIGWTRNKASRILNGVTDPSSEDMEKMSALLGINTPMSFIHYFFPELSTKWTDARDTA